jgi:hypothetical protein
MRIAPLARTLAASAMMAGMLGCGPDPTLGTPPTVCSTHAVNAGKSTEMEPGGTCISCHATYDGPSFVLAGSVMNALNDDTNCAGVPSVTVAITGADSTRVELVSNTNGNFSLERWPGTNLFPYTAEVIRDGVTSKMIAPRQAGENDCNSCHWSVGLNAAPGRIIPP